MKSKILCWLFLIILSSIFVSTPILANQKEEPNLYTGNNVPDCYLLVKNEIIPGALPECAPSIISNDSAFKILNDFPVNPVKKIGYDWYVFLPKKEWNKISYNKKWILLFSVVSAVQSLYSENADVYLAIPPKNETEKGLLLFGNYPQENIIGYAKYITGSLEIPDTRHFPPNCHKRTYTLIIYK